MGNRKISKWFLVIMLLAAAVFPANVFAASGDVTSIEFDNASAVHLYVSETTQQLKVLAKIEGTTDKKDVTSDTTWISSDPLIIKVDKGLLTPLKNGKVTITAKYKNLNLSLTADAAYLFKELKLDKPDNVEYKLGDDNLTVKAQAIENDGTSNDVTTSADWTSSATSVATISAGKLTLISKGETTITAKYKGFATSFKLTVSSPYSDLDLEAVGQPDGDVEMLVGDNPIQIKANAELASDDTVQDIAANADWKSSDPGVVTVDKGKITAVSTGSSIITASYRGATAQVTVLVRTKYEVILLNPSEEQTLFLSDAPLKVEASVRNDVNTRLVVTEEADWTSSNPLAATVTKGVVTPKQAGTAVIKVKYLGLTKEFKVTVFPTLTKITADKTSIDMFKGETESLPKVTGTTLDDKSQDISSLMQWKSSNQDIIKIDNNKLTAVGTGKATLTGKIGTASPIVVEVMVQEKALVLLPADDSLNVVIGKEYDLPKVNAVRENGDEENITDKIEWSLSGTSAVLKNNKIKGLVKGNVILKGTYLNLSIKIPVTVEPQISKIIVEPISMELALKKTKSIKVTGIYTNGTKITLSNKIDWVSSDLNVVTVSGSTVKSIGEGSATLKGSYQDMAVKLDIKVVPTLLKIATPDKKLMLAIGGVKTVALTALYDTGAEPSIVGSAIWTSSKPSVATVSAGKIEAISKGTTTIKAKYLNKTISITITVK
ncbi:hypothetical protein J2Z69_000287 [Paenibacillus shirakamiensis]|uniref:BIG2 domain-containing protein n=1 Tax=Paenibacillus shirakamiensis TaxID=1265935 RepID=A0ABS4JC48_9BACL|nr:hypothetical protein [Paenibacillus shirakamiensis]MBP1999268.1 hypothetical protein [Paenibacillus shirakamiensis]